MINELERSRLQGLYLNDVFVHNLANTVVKVVREGHMTIDRVRDAITIAQIQLAAGLMEHNPRALIVGESRPDHTEQKPAKKDKQ